MPGMMAGYRGDTSQGPDHGRSQNSNNYNLPKKIVQRHEASPVQKQPCFGNIYNPNGYNSNATAGQSGVSPMDTYQYQNSYMGAIGNVQNKQPHHSVSRESNRQNMDKSRKIKNDNSLTTVDCLENGYGEVQQAKAYGKTTPTRRVNIENYRELMNSSEQHKQLPPQRMLNRTSESRSPSLTKSISKAPLRKVTSTSHHNQMQNSNADLPNNTNVFANSQPKYSVTAQAAPIMIHRVSTSPKPVSRTRSFTPPVIEPVVRIIGDIDSRENQLSSKTPQIMIPLVFQEKKTDIPVTAINQVLYTPTEPGNLQRILSDPHISMSGASQSLSPHNPSLMNKSGFSDISFINTPQNQGVQGLNGFHKQQQNAEIQIQVNQLGIPNIQQRPIANINFSHRDYSNLDTINEDKSAEEIVSQIVTKNPTPQNHSKIPTELEKSMENKYTLSRLQSTLRNSHSKKEVVTHQLTKYPYHNSTENLNVSPDSKNPDQSNLHQSQNQHGNYLYSLKDYDAQQQQHQDSYTDEYREQNQDYYQSDSKHEAQESSDKTATEASTKVEELENFVEKLKEKLMMEEDKNYQLQQVMEQQSAGLLQLYNLNQVISQQQDQLKSYGSEYQKVASNNQILAQQIDELNKMHHEASQENAYLSQQQSDLEHENSSLREAIEAVKSQGIQIQRSLEQQNLELSNQNQILLSESQSKSSSFNQNHNALNEGDKNLKADLVYAQEEIKTLKKKRAKDKKKKEKYKKELIVEISKREEIIEGLTSEIHALKHQVRSLQTEIEGYNISESRSVSQSYDDTLQMQKSAEHNIHQMN